MSPEKTFTVRLNEFEINLLINSLAYQQTRQLQLAALARSQGRDKENIARRECAVAVERLSEKLCKIGGAR